MIDLKIPASGDAVTEVQLIEWTVTNGAPVKEGDIIYSIESDKSSMDIEAPIAGTLRILAPAGQVFPVGYLVGQII